MKNKLFYILAGCLCIFYLFMLYLALNPNVSEEFRNEFIDIKIINKEKK